MKITYLQIPERKNSKDQLPDRDKNFYTGTPIESARPFRREPTLQVGGYDEDIVFYEEVTLPCKIEGFSYNVKASISSYILHHEEGFSLQNG